MSVPSKRKHTEDNPTQQPHLLDTPEPGLQPNQLDGTPLPRWQETFHPDVPRKILVSPLGLAGSTMLIGGSMIRYLGNPALARRRFVILGLHSAFLWWNQRRGNNCAFLLSSIATFAPWGDLGDDIKNKRSFAANWLLCQPLLAYGFQPNRRKAHYNAMTSRVTDAMVAKYLEKERIRDRDSSLAEFLSFKYRNFWSSVQTRASVSDVLHAATAANDWGKTIPDQDVRRCTSHIADTLQNGLPPETDTPFLAYFGAVCVLMLSSRRWLLRMAACTSACAAMVHAYYNGHNTQMLSEATRYSNARSGALLHLAYIRRIF